MCYLRVSRTNLPMPQPIKPLQPPPVDITDAAQPASNAAGAKAPTPDQTALGATETLLNWQAPSRVFIKRDRQWFTTVGIILGVIVVIMVLLGQFLLVAALVALAFVGYALSTVSPETVLHQITNRGVAAAGVSYPWEELESFWFDTQHGRNLLHIKTKQPLPGQLTLLLEQTNQSEVLNVLSQHLAYIEHPPEALTSKLSKFISQRVELS